MCRWPGCFLTGQSECHVTGKPSYSNSFLTSQLSLFLKEWGCSPVWDKLLQKLRMRCPYNGRPPFCSPFLNFRVEARALCAHRIISPWRARLFSATFPNSFLISRNKKSGKREDFIIVFYFTEKFEIRLSHVKQFDFWKKKKNSILMYLYTFKNKLKCLLYLTNHLLLLYKKWI